MMYYVFIFAIAILCCYVSEKMQRKGFKKMSVFLKIIAILLPAALAGFRATNIGTDVKFYLISDYNLAINSDNIVDYLEVGYGEPLFLSIVYAATKLFGDINILLFIIELLIVLFIYLGCEKFKKTVPVYISYAFFLFIYYNMSLNLLRQSIALAISFFALNYMLDKKRIKFLVATAVAFMFHRTALVMLVVWALYEIVMNMKNKYLAYFICSLVIGVIVFSFKNIIESFIGWGLIDSKYLYYTQSDAIDTSMTYIGFSLTILAIVLVTHRKIIKNNLRNGFLIFMCIVNVVLLTLSLQYNTAERFTYYFGYANMILAPIAILPYRYNAISEYSTKDAGRKRQTSRFLPIALAIYFLFIASFHTVYYGILGNHKTYPYESEVLNIRGENV